jgi:hypothetical protein
VWLIAQSIESLRLKTMKPHTSRFIVYFQLPCNAKAELPLILFVIIVARLTRMAVVFREALTRANTSRSC